MLKWIINALIIYGIYKLARNLMAGPKEEKAEKVAKGEKVNREEELVEDPQCGTYIPLSEAVKGPKGTYFCSRECLEAFKAKE